MPQRVTTTPQREPKMLANAVNSMLDANPNNQLDNPNIENEEALLSVPMILL